MFFGLQQIVQDHLTGPRVTLDDINEVAALSAQQLGATTPFNRAGREHLVHAQGGRLPLSIYAVPEGTPVATAMS